MKVVILTVVLAAVLSVKAKRSIGTQRSVCTGQPDGSFIAIDESCSSFFVCYNGEPVSQSCEPGSYFDKTNLYCLPDTNNICPQEQCSVDGAFSPHPTNCNLFYVCYEGELVEQSCGNGSYFDKTNLYCLPDLNNVCPQQQCSVDGAFSPHPTNCNLFYVCYEGELVEQSCGNGSYFDKTNLYCLPDINNVCPQQQCSVDGAFSPHPTNCNLFYVCYEGELVEQSCGNGSYFDKTNLYCLPDTNNECPTPQCTVEGAFSPHPTNCNLFYVCYEGELVEQSCGNGSYFDKTNLYCLPDTNNECPTPQCTVEGAFSPHPTNCNLFYVCYEGELVEQSCGNGSYFDKTNLYCLPDINNVCPQQQCSVDGAFSPHPTNCNLFYVCYEGKLVEQSCGNGSYFDKTNLYCLPDTNNECPTPQCTVEGAFSPHLTECALFYVCYNGLLVEQTCGNGSYFDKTNLYCLPDIDNICWASTPTSTAEPCTCVGGYIEGEFVASPDNCYSYYICSDGELVEQNCGYGNYFDNSTKRCERDTTGECWPSSNTTSTSTTAEPCTCTGGYEEGDLVASLENCYSYYVCTQGELVEQNCGYGNYFDSNNKTCVRDTNEICWKTTSTTTTTPAPCLCPGGYEEGDLVGNDDSCHSYFVCTQGELVAESCGTGNYFDSDSNTCVPDKDGSCWKTTSTTTTTPAPCLCPGGYEEGDLVGNDDSCHSYFVCTQGELVAESCGTGNYFDSHSNTCVPDKDGSCWKTTSTTTTTPAPCLCPGGYEEGDLVGNDDSCHSYFVCTQGELVAESCGTGNYFDSHSNTCVRDTNGICWEITSTTTSTTTPTTTSTTTTTPAPCLCPGGHEEGDLVGNDDSCHSYFVCTQGELVAESCGTGNYFDSDSNTCVRDINGICWEITSTTTSTTTPTTTFSTTTAPAPCLCPGGYEEGDLVGNDDSCHSYFVCTQGELVAESCGTGNYFDSDSNTCVRDINGICWEITSTTTSTTTPTTTSTTTTTPAPCLCPGGYEEGDLVGNDDSCHSYFVCTQGELVAESCGTGNYFDSDSNTCVRDINGICWEITSTTTSTTTTTPAPCLCPGGYEEGDLVGNDDSCHSYFVCTQGELVAESCGTGNYFDSDSNTCVRDINGICWELSSSSSTTTKATPSPPTPSPPTPSPTTPSPPTPSPATQSTPTDPCKCPGGYDDGDFIPHPGNCSSFYICYNGELIEESCGNGNYFDEASKSCVLDTTGVCWELSSSSSTTTTVTPSPPTPSPPTPSPPTPSPPTPSPPTPSPPTPSPPTPSPPTPSPPTPSPPTPSPPTPSPPTPSPPTQSTPTEPCKCPGGYDDGDFIPHPGNCSSFYICYNGELIEESCGNGNYFDEASKSCVLDTTGVCWELSTSSSTTTKVTPSPPTPSPPTPSPPTPSPPTPSPPTPSPPTPSPPTPSPPTPSPPTPSPPTPSPPTQSTPTEPCKCPGGYDDGDFIPYPGNCSSFYICYNGELIEESCGNGNYFDEASKSCVLDTTGVCWELSTSSSTTTKVTPSPPTPSPPTPSPPTPSPPTPSPPTPSPPTPSPPTPSPPTPSPPTPSPPTQSTPTEPCKCPGGYDDGDFIPYPGNCSSFYICYNGELIEESCGNGNYFDEASKSCVLDTTGVCWELSTSSSTTTKVTPSPPTPSPPTPSPPTPSPPTPSPPTPLPPTPSPPTPSPPTPSPPTQSTPTEPCKCPGGYDDGDFIPYPGNCSSFYICYNGELIEESCGNGNYFDEASKSCVLDTTGVCWELSTSSSTTTKVTPSPPTPSPPTPSPPTPSPPTPSPPTPSPPTPSPPTPSPPTPSPPTPSPPTQSTPTEPCKCPGGYDDGDFIPYPGNCSSFYICYNGELIEESCGNGNYFDEASKSCVLDTTGVCWELSTSSSTTTKVTPSPPTPSPPTPSPPTPSPPTPSPPTPSPSTPSPPTPSPPTPSPPTPSPPTPSPSTPSPPTPSPPTPSPPTPSPPTPSPPTQSTPTEPCKCPGGYDDGDFIPYPGNCSSFYICYNGELIEESCGNGNYFDEASKSCVLDTTGVCWELSTSSSTTTKVTPSPPTPSPPTPSPPTPSPPTPSPPTPSPPTPSPPTPSPSTPSPPTPSPPTPSPPTPSPPTPSPPTQSTPTEPCKCPGGYDDGDFIPYPGNCSSFYICYNGELIEESCGNGNYFDEASKSCVLDTTGVCWELSTSSSTTTKVTPSPPTPSPPTPSPPTPSPPTPSPPTPSPPTPSPPTPSPSTPSPPTPSPPTPSPPTPSPPTPSPPTPSPPTQSTPTEPCKCPGGYDDGDFIPYPGNCSSFYICYNGELIEESCGNGNYFDEASKSCVLDTTGVCWELSTSSSTTTKVTPSPPTPSPPTPSPPTPSPPTPSPPTPSPPTPSPPTPSPPTPSPPTPSPPTPSPPTPSPPTPSPPTQSTPTEPCKCPGGYDDGDFIPYPGNCSSFYICYNGELIEESCGNGNYFDEASKSCVLDTTGVCWELSTSSSTTTKVTPSPPTPSPPTPSPPTPSPPTPSPPTPSPPTPSPPTPSPPTPSPPTPSPPTPSPPTPSPPTQSTPTEPCKCPGGYDDGDFIPYPGNCSSFYICYNGELIEESCGNGNYFDEASKSCVLDTTGVCWELSTSSSTTTKVTPSPPTPSPPTPSPPTPSPPTPSPPTPSPPTPSPPTPSPPTPSPPTPSPPTPSPPTPSPPTPSPPTPSPPTPSPPTPSPPTQSTPTEPCKCPGGYDDGDFIPYPGNCSSFYICYNGELIEESCGNGNYFDEASKSCVLDTTGVCWELSTSSSTTTKVTPSPPTPSPPTPSPPTPSPPTPSPPTPSPPTPSPPTPSPPTPSPPTPSPPTPSPPTPSPPTPSPPTPSPPTPSPPTPSPPTQSTPTEPCKCPGGYDDGDFIPYPGNCSSFYICYNGELIEESCGNGNYFDEASKSCVLDTTGVCWELSTSSSTTTKVTPSPPTPSPPTPSPPTPSPPTPSPPTPSPPTPSPPTPSPPTPSPPTPSPPTPSPPTPTSSPCTCPGGYVEGEFIPNPQSCYLFYVCYQSELVEVSCGFGNYFDNATKSCVLDTTESCWSKSTSSSTTTAITTTSTSTPCTCPGGYENGEFVPHPDSCYLFFVCYQGELSELSCGTGNFFDNVTKSCTFDTTGFCWTSLTPSTVKPTSPAPQPEPCECSNGLKEGQLTAHPSSCYLYNICYGGELVVGNCGTGNYFNNVTNACEPDTGGCCWPVKPTPPEPQPEPCECSNGLKEGQLTAHPSSCYLYNICYGGELVEGHCGSGNYFNNVTNACEPDTGGCCWPVKPTPPEPQPEPCECSNGLKEGQLTAHPSSCYLYNICYGGELVVGHCGTGNYFNNATNACERDTGGCCWSIQPSPRPPQPKPCECPNGLKEGQFTAHPSSCYLFYICYDGELVQQNCGIGNYFNNNTNICERDTGGCCWPKPKTCPGGYKTGEFVPYPGECDKFFICNEGELVEQNCGIGYLFDIDNKYCTRDIGGICWAVEAPNNTCEGITDGTFVPNEAACDKFFVCYKNGKILQECGIGNLFNRASLVCERDRYGTCWKKVPNVCANTVTGTFVPNPSNCQEFYVCHKNRAVLQQCGNGNWFNPKLMICQPDLWATCINVCQGTKSTTTLAHPNCNQFYHCVNGRTTGVSTCHKGTNYDATDKICKASAMCEADLCSNSTNGAVFPVQNDVTSFYTCYNQMPLKMTCPDGTSFDSALLVCIPDTGRCVGQKNGHVVGSHNNPNAFYACRDNMAIFQQCPSYAIFDEKKGYCVHAGRKRLASNICSAEQNGTMLLGDACNKFHLCLNGENIEQNCGAYSSFNQKLNYCVFNLSCYDQNEICSKSSDIEKFPDARYETSFIQCKQGLAVKEKCPNNMIYSHDIGYCVSNDLALTKDELDELCDNASDNSISPALDCRKFYICRNNIAILQQCAIDQYFDIKTGTCLPDVERQCWIRSETLRRSFHLKTVCHEGQIRVHAGDCTAFEICTYGVWITEACPAGYYFDNIQNMCIPRDSDVMCPNARSAAECLDDMPFRANEKLCTDYYRCEDNQWKAKKCPVGEFFNRKIGTCTKDASACAREREVRSIKETSCSLNETRASDENCSLFHICYEGEWWYRHCEEGAYFNKSLKACVPNDGTCLSISKIGPCKNGTAKKSDFDPCITYHICVDGNWTVQQCPIGHHFNESHKACMLDYEDNPCKTELKNVTSTCVEGTRRYKASNCTAFEICSFGDWLLVPCRAGFYFDTALEMCISNRGECSANGLMRRDCADNTSRQNWNNCSEFYYCSRNEWQLESCLEGFQYNATIDKCIPTNKTCAVRNQSNWTSDKCVGIKSGSYITHETDCTKYYLCIDDQAVEANCSYGKFYDKESKLCQLNDGTCPLKMQAAGTICESKPNGSQVPNPANCTSFYICSDSMALLSYCSPGLYFNPDIGVCQTDTGICNKPRLCDNNPGAHLPHETYCNIYYACVRGVAIPVACEENQIFDPVAKRCTDDVERRCKDGILVGDEICTKAENGGPLVDSDDCTKYILCSNGLAQTIECPRGQFFDSALMFCMPDDGSCPYVDGPDLPNNSSIPPDPISCIGKHGDLMPDPEHCNEFYICIYGNLRHDRCFDGEFFDTKTYSCSKTITDEKCPSAADMSTLCATSEDGINFADQTDCRKYYQCNDAELESKKCRTGESFDTLLGFCRQNDGTCLLENGQRVGACAGKHGKLAVNTENCRGYFTCVNGQKISDECENGEYFDKLTTVCLKDVNNTCRPVENEFTNTTQLSCIGLTELVFYPNILDGCKTFFQCVKGMPRVHKCPDDLLFNAVSGICDWKDYVKCIDMTDHHQKDDMCLKANNGTSYGNIEDNCDSYFICTDGKLKSFKCGQGLKYNVHMEKCDLAANVNCTKTV